MLPINGVRVNDPTSYYYYIISFEPRAVRYLLLYLLSPLRHRFHLLVVIIHRCATFTVVAVCLSSRLDCVCGALSVLPGCVWWAGGNAGAHQQPTRLPGQEGGQLPPLLPGLHLPAGAAAAPALHPHGGSGGLRHSEFLCCCSQVTWEAASTTGSLFNWYTLTPKLGDSK